MSVGTKPSDTYSPLYFLASLGAGGLSVTFFMYLMFWVPHKGRPVPIFEDLLAAFGAGSPLRDVAIAVAVVGIAVFAFLNVKLLAWNFSALSAFKKTEAYAKLRRSNAETSLLAAPLAAAMSVNALFIVGLVFVPQLWTVVEYLFPMALVAFVGIGLWALTMLGHFIGRVLSEKSFDLEANNSFAQLMPGFALAMVAVGLAAPAAMSTAPMTVGVGLVLSTFFASLAILWIAVALVLALPAIFKQGTAPEAAPTLMVIVPILTVLGIMTLRQSHGLHTTFEAHSTAGETLLFLAKTLSVQIAILLAGGMVLRRQGYFAHWVFGPKVSAGSYALVCPGVALSVMIHFFVNKGLVDAGIVAKFGAAYWALTIPALIAQFAMVALVLRLNRQHFGTRHTAQLQPAE
ncbi:MAG: TsoY family (seleno)protein [Lutimaribacter sp.]